MTKRLLSLLLFVFVLAGAVIVSPINVSSARWYLGDINGDQKVASIDYLMLKRYCLGTYSLSATQKAAADIDDSGSVDSVDYFMLKRHCLGTFNITQPDFFTPVSVGKSYTTSIAPASNYSDTYNSELTDGIRVESDKAYYSNTAYCGYLGSVDIILDLGEEDMYMLNKFELSYLDTNEAGISRPASVRIYGSVNNSHWTSIGTAVLSEQALGTPGTATYMPDTEVHFRYIKFSVTRNTSWVFIDEISVYANVADYTPTPEDSYDKAYSKDSLTDTQYLSAINGVASGSFDSALDRIVISEGCDVSITTSKYDARVEDADASLLTDCVDVGAHYERNTWVAFDCTTSPSKITVDLGQVTDDVCGFELYAFNMPSANIYLPTYVTVSVGDSLSNMAVIARSYGVSSDQENYSYRVMLDKRIAIRYVTFTVYAESGYCWFEEAVVYGNRKKPDVSAESLSVYGGCDIPVITTPEYWSVGSDYNTVQNLVLGKPQEIATDVFLDSDSYAEFNTSESTQLLTDGSVPTNTYCYSYGWVHFNRGQSRKIIYDLGKTSAVSSFSVNVLDYNDWSIELPEYFYLVLSEDGENWYRAGEIYPVHDDDVVILTCSLELDKSYRARYAMICFPIQIHVFLGEISVYGTKNINGAVSLADSGLSEFAFYPDAALDELGFAAPSEDILGGVEDLMLIYHTGTTVNEDFLLPYVAYLDKNGNIVDTMFDGYLFLPTTGELPSGGRPYGDSIKSDWDYLFDDIFKTGYGMDALEATAKRVGDELSIEDFKLKVYITIPHMSDTITNFGDVDRDGISEDLSELDDRLKVAEWYVDRVRAEFDSREYDHLELYGFYWFHEAISGSDATTAQRVNALLDEKGEQLFWIPYFQAQGFTIWENLGFDVACLQPNYAFSLSVDESRLKFASQLAQLYGLCIEIEIQGIALGDDRYFDKYMNYLQGGITYGYINDCIHMYYQGVKDFYNACYSSSAKARLIYDYTYDFIKGTLEVTPDTPKDLSFDVWSGSPLKGSLKTDAAKPYTEFRLEVSPEHGTVSISEDGTFTYYPNKGYTGTDTFSYSVSEQLGWSEIATVTVNVD